MTSALPNGCRHSPIASILSSNYMPHETHYGGDTMYTQHSRLSNTRSI